VFDALDGQVARLAKSSTKFGAQLDSLCDVITFGVAPGFLLVKLVPVFTFYYPAQIWTIAAVFPACAALRLARFTVETNEEDDHSTFRGLPSPAAAASIACFGILFYTLGSPGEVKEYSDWNMSMIKVLQYTLPFFSLAVSAFMVSRIPYPHLTNRLIRGRKSFAHLIGLFFAIVALTVFHSYIIPLVTFYFVFASPVTYLWRRWRQPQQSTETIF
jgi:CDP-diacylglycerol---serine O-phosphatidyltransferase